MTSRKKRLDRFSKSASRAIFFDGLKSATNSTGLERSTRALFSPPWHRQWVVCRRTLYHGGHTRGLVVVALTLIIPSLCLRYSPNRQFSRCLDLAIITWIIALLIHSLEKRGKVFLFFNFHRKKPNSKKRKQQYVLFFLSPYQAMQKCIWLS